MGQTKSQSLPLLPLGDNAVLLPGTTLRVPVTGRSDVPALLTSFYTRAKSPRPDTSTILIGCVPLNSPLLSSDGQLLISSNDEDGPRRADVDLDEVMWKDLFTFGTMAKISGVQGRRTTELALVLEGTKRFRIQKVTQRRPFFEAQVVPVEEEGKQS